MITRQEFPYLQELVINDAYTVKNLRVPVFGPGQAFKHLVLTGRNGSGKTTVLRGLSYLLQLHGAEVIDNEVIASDNRLRALLLRQEIDRSLNTLKHLLNTKVSIFNFFEANRKTEIKSVDTVLRESVLENKFLGYHPNGPASPVEFFKQYLVNKKVFQAFAIIDGKNDIAQEQEDFFTDFQTHLRKIFSDPALRLEFIREDFEFYLVYSNGHRITFNQLSAGFSAFLGILMDLFLRVDLLRKLENNYTYNPCGFVLIDEPETHLHLEMQYQILPLLTSLFPNLQFIVATHSPAVASSIKNATVFDLSSGQALGDSAAGSSFSELMQTHFGLENEYSNVADKILAEVTEIGEMPDRAAARERLQRLLEEQGRYMSPVLRLDVQAHLLHLQREQAA